ELHAQLLKALAHPKRLEIIHLIRDQELSVSDIHQMLDLPQANISQHLMLLRDTGIVKTRRDGKQIFYSLVDQKFIQASDLMRTVTIQQLVKSGKSTQEALMKLNELVPLVHDPVCQMRVSPKTAGFSCEYNHQAYYFCASGCIKLFQKDPAKYV
ncbi:MAG: metalloregulator ArsR/SmtB family transcription factor, partial [Candidatus Pacebacteria bacterium]|nr:metalloregulator ArsR/SmtB family transcription factor [Candidatus Paceibacterota bacterium]